MRIRAGYELIYECPHPVAMILFLSVHPSRRADLLTDAAPRFSVPVRDRAFVDPFGNVGTRIVAPPGTVTVSTTFEIRDDGRPDPEERDAVQHAVEDLPDAALTYLLGSRFCETEPMGGFAWSEFGGCRPGWPRVRAICDFVHHRLRFDYAAADPMRTARGALEDRVGVCRDFAHLAIALCRCLNIPARYCAGYLGDIGVPPAPYPMDFSSWMEVYLGGRWHPFDPRHNRPRIGRILMATGRDATDVPISLSFGPSRLVGFKVVTEEMAPA